MLHIKVIRSIDNKVISAEDVTDKSKSLPQYESRWDWKTFEAAQEVAAALGPDYIATDAGTHVSPRFDVQKLPKIGEDVSCAFNGDYYPCGKIVSISKSLRVIVAEEQGHKRAFYRVRNTGSWRNNGTWFLVSGHINKRNPEF